MDSVKRVKNGEWKKYKLGDLGIIVTGKTPSKNNPEDWGNEMPFITPTDYKNYRKKAYSSERKLSKEGIERLNNKILPPKSILVTCIGSDMGKVVINAISAITNQQINAIIPDNSKIDNDFLYYQLISLYEILRIYGGDGTAVPIVNKGDFETIIAEIPSLLEQKTIAFVLSNLDDKIDLLHRQNKTLEAIAETLFRQWFVPARAGEPHAGREEAQEDWGEGKLGEVIGISSGKGLKKKEYVENGSYPVLGANGEIGRTDKCLFDEKLIFTGRVGTLGKIFISTGKVWLSDNTLIIKPKEDYFYFVYFLLKNVKLEEYNVGSTQPLIRQSDIKEIEILLPKKEQLYNFEAEADLFFKKMQNNQLQIRILEQLRDALLPNLMSGEVRMKV